MDSVTEIEGDLFDAPDGATLIHACNCQGSWGKGIAAGFREKYPDAYNIYRAHCHSHRPPTNRSNQTGKKGKDGTTTTEQKRRQPYPEGTALIIAPQQQPEGPEQELSNESSSHGDGGGGDGKDRKPRRKQHWIVCLFTSYGYGPRGRSDVETILHNTRAALDDLKAQLEDDYHAGHGEVVGGGSLCSGASETTEAPGPLFACRLNAGLFGVPWEQTKGVMEESGLKVTVVRPPGE